MFEAELFLALMRYLPIEQSIQPDKPMGNVSSSWPFSYRVSKDERGGDNQARHVVSKPLKPNKLASSPVPGEKVSKVAKVAKDSAQKHW